MNKRLLSLIGISRRAGYLVYGFDTVRENVLKDNNGVVILTCDIAENTKKKVNQIEGIKNIIISDLTKNDINSLIGKYSGVIYIKSSGLSEKIIKEYNER